MKDNTKTRMTTFIKMKFKGKYNIGFGISIKFPSQRKKNY